MSAHHGQERDEIASGPRGEAGDDDMRMHLVAGSPTPEEIAAVTAVLRAAVDETERHRRTRVDEARSEWSSAASALRRPLVSGPGTWRRSLR